MFDILRKYEWAWVCALLCLALLLRIGWTGVVPPGVRFDELVNLKMVERLYAGERPIYFHEAWGHEPLYHYLHAVTISLVGWNVLGVRLLSNLFGTLGVLTAYLVFRRLAGRRVAGLAAFLLAVSFWSLLYSRFGERHISLPPWVCLAAYSFWRGLEAPVDRPRQVIGWFALGGICVGVGLYVYFASRLVPLIFAAFVLYLALFHRSMLRGRQIGLLLFFLLPVLIVLPMALYLYRHPELESRLGQVGGEALAAVRAGNWRMLWGFVVDTLKMFSLRGDPEWLYNISGRPVFDPLTAIPFYVGLGLALWGWRRPRYAFMLIWLAVGLIPSVLSWPRGSLGHTIVAQPITFFFPALALVSAWRWADHLPRPALRHVVTALAALVAVVFAFHNVYDYLYRWPRFADVRHEYQAPITAVARYLDAHPEITVAAISAPYVDYWNPWSKMNFELYRSGTTRVAWFNGQTCLLVPAEETYFFLPDHINLPSGLSSNLNALFRAGATPLATDYPADGIGSTFDLYRWSNRALPEAWWQAVNAAPIWIGPETVYLPGESEQTRIAVTTPDFGGRLSLVGYEYARTHVSPGETWQITTVWQVLGGHGGPLAIFVHLLNDQNQVVAGWDGLQAAVDSWKVGDLLIHEHQLTLPADLSPGPLRVQLGVYAPDTLNRLPITVADGQAVPYDRLLLMPIAVTEHTLSPVQ